MKFFEKVEKTLKKLRKIIFELGQNVVVNTEILRVQGRAPKTFTEGVRCAKIAKRKGREISLSSF